jgi:peptide/nickel transport system substrate-binding protein
MRNRVPLRSLEFFSFILVILAVLVLSGCSSPASSPTPAANAGSTAVSNQAAKTSSVTQPQYGGTIKIGFNRDATFLGDPVNLQQQQDCVMSRPVIESLARYDSSGKLVPWLASSWETDASALTMTIKLKSGIKFHDGADFNAEAVKFNLDRFKNSNRGEIKNIKSVDVIDNNTVKLTLGSWDSTIDGAVLYFAGNMISPQAFQKNGQAWCEKNPVGTGPFKFVSWTRDVSIKYQKNPDYWQKGKPYLDNIEFSVISDTMVRMAALDKREIDVMERLDSKDVANFKANSKYNVVDLLFAGIGVVTVVPDSGHPGSPFANLKVRQALDYAIDKQAIVNTILMGNGIVASQYVDAKNWSYNSNVKALPYDVNKAKQLLAEAGYPNGFKFTIYAKNLSQDGQLATAIQGFLGKAGVTGEVSLMSDTMFNEIAGDKGWNNAVNILDLRGGPDPALIIPRYYGRQGKPAWLTSVMRAPGELEAMDEAIASRTMEVKQAALQKLQSIMFDQYLISVPLYHDVRCLAKYANIHDDGMYIADSSVWTPEDVWLSK